MAWSGLQVPRSAQGGVISIGNFDGVHRGHQAMLADVVSHARRLSLPAVVVTFDPHPVSVLRPDVSIPRLTTISTRQALLKQHGVDEMVVLPVVSELLNMAPLRFFHDVVQGNLNAKGIVEGPDFRFGKNRAGDIEFLRKQCDQNSIYLSVFPAVLDEDQMISSTRIRSLLSDGQVSKAVELLGYPYTISGSVGRGAGRGHKLGIPTANLENVNELVPQDGVYAATCKFAGSHHAVAVNIGPNPTFVDYSRKIECHIIDFSGDIYDQFVQVQLIRRIRSIRKFDGTKDLLAQVRKDIEDCKIAFFDSKE